ncbi:MAG: amino acid adenylation domain-containing protein, partial [Candidatus Promineifilaceae bacterium]|nr:amino acid adenylation domain-containing protein [Candidatus Promineifilaceae bacterium]
IEMGLLEIELDVDDTFASLAEKVLAETLSGLAHMQPGISSAATNQAYDVILNFLQPTFTSFAGHPISYEWVHTGFIDRAHNLRLQVIDFEGSGSFSLALDMKTDLFGPEEQALLVQHFLTVLDAFIDNYQKPIGSFSLLSAGDKQRLLVEFNDTGRPYAKEAGVVQLFEAQVACTPQSIAVEDDGESITYAALNEQANRLAHYLREQGVNPETTVAIRMKRSIDVLAAIWGVLKAGGAFMPIDPAYPEERIAFMVDNAGATIILTTDEVAPAKNYIQEQLSIVNPARLDLSTYPSTNPGSKTKPHNLAYVIYTSGSTGRPKGVMITHQCLVNYASWAQTAYQDKAALDFPLYSSLAFDLTITSIFVPLLSGGKVVVYGESSSAPGLEILSVFAEDKVDIVKLTPAHLALVREQSLNNRRMRKLIVGGEDFKTELARDIYDMFNGQVEIYNEYGPTEATVGCMIHKFDPQVDTAVSVPIGSPAANARVYLWDAHDQPVPRGVVGEMVISGDGVARGYHQRPELTAERFGEDPFHPGARIYRTGDMARWNMAGQMVFLGRKDDQVKIGGARIELSEIEAQLAGHDSLQDVVVSVVEIEKRPEPDELNHCIKCGLPSNYPEVTFNSAGVCSLCLDFDAFREEVFRYFGSRADLQQIVAQAKAESSGDYDCMMLFSGGKDSSYVLCQLVEMGLNVLAFSLDNGYISEEAKENIRRVTDHLGVDLIFATTPHMNAIFADSLERYSNVCQGCYKTIYTLSMKLAREKGIKYIFTGLSQGQLFETRLDELFRNRIFDLQQTDKAVLAARKVYHRIDDAVRQLLDVKMFADDRVFGEIQFVDFFRYSDVELDEIYDYLSTRVPWIRPKDTGRSTNCLINEAGIFVHQTERGYHNYALPYSWDVRLGHKTREEAMEELNDDIRPS